MTTATLNARVDSKDKERFAEISNALGLTPSGAIGVFVKKFNQVGGFPFDVRVTAEPFATEDEARDFADALSKEAIADAW